MPLLQSTIPSNATAVVTSDGMAVASRQKVQRPKATWRHSPQKVWLRRAMFQVHLWLGIVLAAYSVVIGVSGAVLVFHEEIEHALYERAWHIAPGPHTVTLTDAVKAIEQDRAGWRVVGLRDFYAEDKPVLALMRPTADPANTNLRYVYFDARDGHVLQDRMRYSGPLGFLYHLHLYLLMGRLGLTISGWMAVGLLLLCISGIVVWWPGVTRWARSLTLRRNVGWKRLNWDLHSVVGFWCCAALTGVAFTGVYFAFPLPVAGAVVKLTGGQIQTALKFAVLPKATPAAAGTPIITIDRALSIAIANRGDAPLPEYLQIPQKKDDVYGGLSYYPSPVKYLDARRIGIDPHTGAILRVVDTRTAPTGVRVVQYFHSIHFGTFAGNGVLDLVVRSVWVLVGLSPALLAVTGLVMYWNRKLRHVVRRLTA